MLRNLIFTAVLVSLPAAAQETIQSSDVPAGRSLDLFPGGGGGRDQPLFGRLFGGAPAPDEDEPDGLIGSTFAALERVLEKLGVTEDDLASALSDVHIEDAGDNWREENSGELSLSFDVNRRLSVGPSFGLHYEEENLGGPEDPWSQLVKFGAKLNF